MTSSPHPPVHLLYAPHDLASLSGGVQWSTHFLLETLQSWGEDVFCLSYSRPELVPEERWLELPRPVRRMTGFPPGTTEQLRKQIESLAPRSIMLNGVSIVADLTFLRACVPGDHLDRTAALWKSSISRNPAVFEDLDPVATAVSLGRERVLRWSRHRIARRVGYNVVSSLHQTEDLEACGVQPDRILFAQEPVAGFVVPTLRADGGPTLRARYLEDDEFGVLVSSRIQTDKGLTWLPPMAHRLQQHLDARGTANGNDGATRSRVRVSVAGNVRSPELQERLERETADLGPAVQIDFLGHQSQEVMAELYATHDVLFHPSPEEGFGRAFIEAMQAGMGVVGNRTCRSLTHMLRAAKAGAGSDIGAQSDDPAGAADFIWGLLNDPDRCARMGHDAQAWASAEFTIERATDDLRAMMAALTGR